MQGPDDTIELTVPAAERHSRVVRLVASAAARECGFGIDRIDDVRLAVGEAFLLGAAVSSGSPLTISIRPERERLHIRVSGLELAQLGEAGPDEARLRRYGLLVLGMVADEVHFEPTADGLELQMTISGSAPLSGG